MFKSNFGLHHITNDLHKRLEWQKKRAIVPTRQRTTSVGILGQLRSLMGCPAGVVIESPRPDLLFVTSKGPTTTPRISQPE